MARKSPRSRKKQAPKRRLGGTKRARSTPRKSAGASSKKRAKGAASASGTHARKGARRKPNARAGIRTGAAGKKTPARHRVTKRRGSRFKPPDPERVSAVLGILEDRYDEPTTALDFGTPLQLLVATILSAQCTDARVNMVTPVLFGKYPDANALASVPQEDLEEVIRSTGFFRNKARSIRECCADIVNEHDGEVPNTMEALTKLRGVGRKTANVVLGNAFGIPGLVVDTHVTRLSNRLGFTDQKDAVKIEYALQPIVPERKWTVFSHWLILHGRQICVARKPRCSICPLAPHCPRIHVTVAE